MRKILVVCFIGALLPVVLPGQTALADVDADLIQAQGLYQAGQYAQAESPYLKVLSEADAGEPEDAEAIATAAKGLVLVYIATDRLPQAKEAIQPLLNRSTPEALHQIVDEAKALDKVPAVLQLYQETLAAQPNGPGAVWLKTGIAIADVHLADDEAVESILQDIAATGGSDGPKAEAFGQIAWAYRKLAQYEKALTLNQYAIDHWPGADGLAYAQQGIAVSQVALGNLAAADEAVDALIQRFGRDPDASKLVLWSGFAYNDAGHKAAASRVYDLVVQNYPDTPEAIVALQGIVGCQVAVGNLAAADKAVDVLIQQYGQSPDTPKLVLWSAFTYEDNGHRDEAGNVYELLAQNFPDAPEAMDAQLRLSLAALDARDPNRMEQTIVPLIQQFEPTEHKADSLHYLAEALNWTYVDCAKQPDRYEDILVAVDEYLLTIAHYSTATWPESEWAGWAQRDLATVAIHRGDEAAAQAAVDRLTEEQVNGGNRLAALNSLADFCLEMGKPGWAEQVYKYVSDHSSEREQSLLAQAGQIRSLILQGRDDEAEEVFQRMLSMDEVHPRLIEAVRIVGESYWEQATVLGRESSVQPDQPGKSEGIGPAVAEKVQQYRQKALEKFELMIRSLPEDATNTPFAYHCAGYCCSSLGQWERAIGYFKEVCETWPDYEGAWSLPNQIAGIYNRMKREGMISGEQADELILRAYQRTIDEYPNYPSAKAAQTQIRRYQQRLEEENRRANRILSLSRGGK